MSLFRIHKKTNPHDSINVKIFKFIYLEKVHFLNMKTFCLQLIWSHFSYNYINIAIIYTKRRKKKEIERKKEKNLSGFERLQ